MVVRVCLLVMFISSACSALAINSPDRVDGCLLLRNGNVLAGRVARDGKYYRVERPEGEILVPAVQAIRFCGSLEEAYRVIRNLSDVGSARAHLELAKWCLRKGLLSQAARELLDARTLDAKCRGLAAAERQLRQQLELQDIPRTPVAPSPAAVELGDERNVKREQSRAESSRVAVGTKSQATFVRSIQPMLIQSCLTGGCHSAPGEYAFQLNRYALAAGGHAELTRQNLAAASAQLDFDQPELSPLVQLARRKHGDNGSGQSQPLTSRQAELLIAWAYAATGKVPAVVEPAEAEAIATASGDEAPVVQPAEKVAAPTQTKSEEPPAFKPRDRFDPEIFNRARLY